MKVPALALHGDCFRSANSDDVIAYSKLLGVTEMAVSVCQHKVAVTCSF
jgi:predicted O-linked N-acetylglucosamine transferase (SPINDLY family)